MKPNISTNAFHAALIKELFHQPLTQEEVFCLMLLLHACPLRLTDDAEVTGQVKGFAEITSRHAAEVVSKLFTSGAESDYTYWYWHWNGDWNPYDILASPPDQLLPTLRRIRETIESHPWIEKIVDEDWNLLSKLD